MVQGPGGGEIRMNRRDFLRLSSTAAVGVVLAGCAPPNGMTEQPSTNPALSEEHQLETFINAENEGGQGNLGPVEANDPSEHNSQVTEAKEQMLIAFDWLDKHNQIPQDRRLEIINSLIVLRADQMEARKSYFAGNAPRGYVENLAGTAIETVIRDDVVSGADETLNETLIHETIHAVIIRKLQQTENEGKPRPVTSNGLFDGVDTWYFMDGGHSVGRITMPITDNTLIEGLAEVDYMPFGSELLATLIDLAYQLDTGKEWDSFHDPYSLLDSGGVIDPNQMHSLVTSLQDPNNRGVILEYLVSGDILGYYTYIGQLLRTFGVKVRGSLPDSNLMLGTNICFELMDRMRVRQKLRDHLVAIDGPIGTQLNGMNPEWVQTQLQPFYNNLRDLLIH